MSNKMMVVTGAAVGTGFGIARKFAAEGWNVCVTSRKLAGAEEAAQKIMDEFPAIKAVGMECQGPDEAVIAGIFDKLDEMGYQVEAMVCNAANQGIGQAILDTPFEDWRAVFECNIFMNFMFCRNAAKHMIKHGVQGSIVIVGSNTAYRPLPERSAYCTTKAALATLAKAFAVEMAKYKIRSNYLAIGSIKTARWDSLSEEIHQTRLARAPLRDVITFEDVANSVYFLCTDNARLMTGAEIMLDAGVNAAFPCGNDNG